MFILMQLIREGKTIYTLVVKMLTTYYMFCLTNSHSKTDYGTSYLMQGCNHG